MMPTVAQTYLQPSSEMEWMHREKVTIFYQLLLNKDSLQEFSSSTHRTLFYFHFRQLNFSSYHFSFGAGHSGASLFTLCYLAILKRCCQISQLSYFF